MLTNLHWNPMGWSGLAAKNLAEGLVQVYRQRPYLRVEIQFIRNKTAD